MATIAEGSRTHRTGHRQARASRTYRSHPRSFTAMDAYIRDYRIVVPPDCIGAPHAACTSHALFILGESLRARTPRSPGISFPGEARTR